HDMAERFSSKAALNSPPHITLYMPFKLQDKKLTLLNEILAGLAAQTSDFQIRLTHFDCFEPRVIFVALPENEPMNALQKRVLSAMKKLNLFNGNYKDRAFHP